MESVDVKIYRDEKGKKVKLPKYMTDLSSGMDVYSIENKIIEAKDTELIKTGLYVEIPRGFEIQIRPRSGLAYKKGVSILNTPGTIDADYRGEIGIILTNFSSKKFEVKKDMRIAQMVLSKVYKINWQEVEQLKKTKRGSGCFGHTGS